jgi:hypothetical protein
MVSNRKSTMPMGKDGRNPPSATSPVANLAEALIPNALAKAAARFVDSLKINSVSEKIRRGRRVVIKRRNGYSEPLVDLANLYFRMAGIPIRFWAKSKIGGDGK